MPKNIFANIAEDLPHECVEILVQGKGVKVERIVSQGQYSSASEWYDQAQNEWVMLLQGEATLCFENHSRVYLKSGDYVRILAHQKHQITWTHPTIKTIWLAIFYDSTCDENKFV